MMAQGEKQWFTPALLWTTIAGSLGGFIGYMLAGPFLTPFFDTSLTTHDSYLRMWLGQALLMMFAGVCTATAILVADNHASLRGRWNRDVARGIPLFALYSFVGGAIGHVVLNLIHVSRAPTWAIAGAAIGYSIGKLRNDEVQAKRAALGGAIGGAVSGVLVDLFLLISFTNAAFALASMLGTLITGALIGLFMRFVQDAMKTAWIAGVTTGPYEGKQYLLNTQRVTVGSSELHDISLYRASELRVPAGALEFKNGSWRWSGESVEINGVPQTDVPLKSGDSIKLGATVFRFQTKSGPSEYTVPNSAPPVPVPHPAVAPVPSPVQAPVQAPAAPVPPAAAVSWALVGNYGSVPLPAPPARVKVGRGETNDVVLTDPGVSSQHAVIDVGPYDLQITDMQSTNGVTVNGARMPAGVPVKLTDGDTVLLGQLVFRVRRGG